MASTYPLGLLTRDEAESIASKMGGLLTNGGNTYTIWENSSAPTFFNDWGWMHDCLLNAQPGNDTYVILVINDTGVPLILDGDPAMTHGFYAGGPPTQGMPAKATIPASVEGMPTLGYFRFERNSPSSSGILGAFSFSSQSPDVPDGITLGFQSGGNSSWSLQAAAVIGESASSCADDLNNSKYGTGNSCSKNNLSVSMYVQASQFDNDAPPADNIYVYFAVAYVRCSQAG